MYFKKVLAIIILTILLFSSISSIAIATDADTNNVQTQNTITNETNEIQKENTIVDTTESNTINENIISETKNEIDNSKSTENIVEQNNIEENNINDNIVDENKEIETKESTEKDIISNEVIDDNSKVSVQTKELLDAINIKDVNKLSSRIEKEQMKNLLLQTFNNSITINMNDEDQNQVIWVDENARELISNFINNHSSYTYTINENGYIVCDNVLRINENLDIVEPAETEVDIAIRNVMKEYNKIILKISENYFEFNADNTLNSIPFEDDMKSKAYEFDGLRLILLNPKFYNMDEIEYNLPLSDDFIKTLDNIQYKVLTGEIQLSKEQIVGNGDVSLAFTDNGQALRYS